MKSPAIARTRHRNRCPASVAAVSCAVFLLGGSMTTGAQPASRPVVKGPRRPAIVDHEVVPAGGVVCPTCRVGICAARAGHLAECRDGLCAPHCPVRPVEYGFYGTRWRRWPGAGVVPASAAEAATPVGPAASQIPSADEESPRGPPNEEPLPAADDLPTDPIPERPGQGDPARKPGAKVPAAREPADPSGELPVPPVPPGEKPIGTGSGAEDGGLFDQSAFPPPVIEVPSSAGAMRYPARVGRSLAVGDVPGRARHVGSQRAGDSARGL